MAEKGKSMSEIYEYYSYRDFEFNNYIDQIDEFLSTTKKNQLIDNKKINVKPNLFSLPTEILLRILCELILLEKPSSPKTVVISLPLVCKLFYKLSHDKIIWEQVFMSDYDIEARKRRFMACNFRKIFYRRSSLNNERMAFSIQMLEISYNNDSSPSELILDNILDELTCLWVLISENDGVNLKKLNELEAPEFCCRIFNLLFADMDSSLKHLACVFISLKIISMMLAYGTITHGSNVEKMLEQLRERIINWDPTKDTVFPMLDCHALHIYLAYRNHNYKNPIPSESLVFDARKSDKWLQWTDMVDVYSSNKILWCLRNDGYDWPSSPPKRWKGLCTDPTITTIQRISKMDIIFTEVEIDKRDVLNDYDDSGDDEGTYNDNSSCYTMKGELTDHTGTNYHMEGKSFPIDKGRRVNLKFKDDVNFYGFMTAFGIIGRSWRSSENSGFFWIWPY